MRRFLWGRADADIESQLRANRPEPRPEVLEGVVSRIVGVRDTARRRPAKRHWVAIAGCLGLIAVLASFGAVSPAQKGVRDTVTATADAAGQIVSRPSAASADPAVKSANTLKTDSSSTTAGSSVRTSNPAGGGIAPTSASGNVETPLGSAGLSDTAGLDLPSIRFLATIGNYAANQWICHYLGGPPQAPGQWQAIQLTSMAIYLAHAGHPADHGPYATEPSQIFCAENRPNPFP